MRPQSSTWEGLFGKPTYEPNPQKNDLASQMGLEGLVNPAYLESVIRQFFNTHALIPKMQSVHKSLQNKALAKKKKTALTKEWRALEKEAYDNFKVLRFFMEQLVLIAMCAYRVELSYALISLIAKTECLLSQYSHQLRQFGLKMRSFDKRTIEFEMQKLLYSLLIEKIKTKRFHEAVIFLITIHVPFEKSFADKIFQQAQVALGPNALADTPFFLLFLNRRLYSTEASRPQTINYLDMTPEEYQQKKILSPRDEDFASILTLNTMVSDVESSLTDRELLAVFQRQIIPEANAFLEWGKKENIITQDHLQRFDGNTFQMGRRS